MKKKKSISDTDTPKKKKQKLEKSIEINKKSEEKEFKKRKKDHTKNNNNNDEPEQNITNPTLKETNSIATNEPKWKKVGNEIKKKDIVTYKLLEIGEDWQPLISDWRCGIVSKIKTKENKKYKKITLKPWPDPLIHPDPKWYPNNNNIDDDKLEEEDEFKAEKILEKPQSQYDEKGKLKKYINEFHDIRYFGRLEKEEKNEKMRKKQNLNVENETVKKEEKKKGSKRGVYATLAYLKNTKQI